MKKTLEDEWARWLMLYLARKDKVEHLQSLIREIESDPESDVYTVLYVKKLREDADFWEKMATNALKHAAKIARTGKLFD